MTKGVVGGRPRAFPCREDGLVGYCENGSAQGRSPTLTLTETEKAYKLKWAAGSGLLR